MDLCPTPDRTDMSKLGDVTRLDFRPLATLAKQSLLGQFRLSVISYSGELIRGLRPGNIRFPATSGEAEVVRFFTLCVFSALSCFVLGTAWGILLSDCYLEGYRGLAA